MGDEAAGVPAFGKAVIMEPDMGRLMEVELKRKAFHLLSLLYVLGYLWLGRARILQILVPILCVEGAIESARLLAPGLNAKLMALFGGIQREEESHHFSGIFWTLAGSVLTFALFGDRALVLCAMGYLIFGDLAAALVGVRFGRRNRFGKSIAGSLACWAACVLVGAFFLPPGKAILAGAFAAFVEFLPLPFNDNLWVPVFSGMFLRFLL